jgi:hypothetical protein
MNAEADVVDRHVAPDAAKQVFFADDLARALDESKKDIERPPAKINWRLISDKEALGRKQLEGAEDKAVSHRLSRA